MASEIYCPICHSTLRIPDGCEGQTAKCPNCSADFVIPGAPVPSATPICAVLVSAPGNVTFADVQRAESAAGQLAAEDLSLQIQLADSSRKLRSQTARLSTLQMFLSGRKAIDHSVGRVGGFFLAVTLGAAAMVLMFSLFSPSAIGYLIAITLGIVAATAAYLPFSFFPDDPSLGSSAAQQSAKVQTTTLAHEQLATEADAMRQRFLTAEAEHHRLKSAIESRLHWLRTCQWPQMTGANFENFLTLVFQERGYLVEHIGRTGDQGVDLIVSRDGTRVAVQAKGYPASTVGNEAVQQVHAGMAYHRCNAAAVVTNSQFSVSARQLAERIGCRLIDGGQIPDLIDGRIIL